LVQLKEPWSPIKSATIAATTPSTSIRQSSDSIGKTRSLAETLQNYSKLPQIPTTSSGPAAEVTIKQGRRVNISIPATALTAAADQIRTSASGATIVLEPSAAKEAPSGTILAKGDNPDQATIAITEEQLQQLKSSGSNIVYLVGYLRMTSVGRS